MNIPFREGENPATAGERLVVIGNGMAGMRTVEDLLKHEAARR